MFSLYSRVAVEAARRAVAAWPALLAYPVYAVILVAATMAFAPLGMIGGLLIGLVVAACWSSYLELISQAVAGSKIHIRWDDFRRTFLARFWDVISVMFAFWIISFLTGPLTKGPSGAAAAGVIGFAMAFFFNAVPELLYQGQSRSFALLLDSARFMFRFPVAWLLPNVLLAALALAASGLLRQISHPAEALIAFGSIFSFGGIAAVFLGIPRWSLPIALVVLHYVMIFRGLLFHELVSGGGNARLRAFQAKMRG
ncbi:MAG TPA: hypothetical protein VIF57_29050 [Polyangia bacterium]|jgi:hypothetical protein